MTKKYFEKIKNGKRLVFLRRLVFFLLVFSMIHPPVPVLAAENPDSSNTHKSKSKDATLDEMWDAVKDDKKISAQANITRAPDSEVSIPPSPDIAGFQDVHDVKWPEKENKKAETISIRSATSQVFRFDRPLSRVAISDTAVCDVTTLAPQEVLLYCNRPGHINMLVWDADYKIGIYDIQSMPDVDQIKRLIEKVDPKADIKVTPFLSSVMVSGTVSTNEKAKKVEDIIKSFGKDTLSYIRVADHKQIMLEVRFAEIDRRASEQYGLDAEFLSRWMLQRSFTGEVSPGTANAGSTFVPRGSPFSTIDILDGPSPSTSNYYIDFFDNRYYASALLKWLEQKNILKLTAHPNLLALDGQEASFVVGGESPYLTATTTSVNVEFKEFGTKLTFKPEVLDNNIIRLNMKTEVSELDFSTTVSLQGTTVPTLVKNTHQTTAELGDNQTLVIGGLVNQRINEVTKKVPILGDIRGLDKLFKRRTFDRKDVEILVVVTPHLIEPMDNPVKKKLYPIGDVLDATSAFVPAYPDMQGDMVNRLLVQGERYNDFDGFAVKRAKEVEKEFVEIKKKETDKQKALRYATGLKIQDQPATAFAPPETTTNARASS